VSTYQTDIQTPSLSIMGITPRRITVEEIESMLLEPSGGVFVVPHNDWDEVYTNVYLGGKDLGIDIEALQSLGVTHVLNAAKGHHIGQVDTNPGYFRKAGIEFLGVPATDSPTFPIRSYFHDAASFIEQGLYGGGKVYVHCESGISRAPTLVIAFLMIRRQLSLRQAIAAVRSTRSIFPNSGFLEYLIDLDYANQQRGLTRPEPEQFSAMDELHARYDYPLEYYHYPSLFPRVSTRFSRPVETTIARCVSPSPERAPRHLSRAELRHRIRAISEDREIDMPRRSYRASSVPSRSDVVIYRSTSPIRAVERAASPCRDIVPYVSPVRTTTPFRSYWHVDGYRTPRIPFSYIDQQIMYRPSTVTYTPKPLSDFEPFSTYRNARGFSTYMDLPSDAYDTLERRKVRYSLEPRFTSPVSSSIVPSTRYRSATLTSPVTRYMSTPTRVYVSCPTRYTHYPRNYLTVKEPHLYRSTHSTHKLGDGFPTRFQTYKVVRSALL